MAFYGYNGDAGECYWTPYTSNYDHDYDPGQVSSAYSNHDQFNQSELIEYTPCPEIRYDGFWERDNLPYNYSELFATTPEVNYSTYGFSEPKLLRYEPAPYVTGYISSETKYTICYSIQELIVPEFEEYDPTPYGGGYDSTQVYGKPLPPSDEICYPLSDQRADGYSLEGFSFASIPSPYGKEDDNSTKPQNGGKQSDHSTKDDEDLETHRDNGDQVTTKDEKREDDHASESDHDDKVGNGGIGEYGYECSRQVPNMPYGSGLEAMDLCECIFGHWPCLDRMNRERSANQEVFQRESNSDPWKSTADYLFEWPFGGYGEQKDGGYGDYAYCHGSYAQHGW